MDGSAIAGDRPGPDRFGPEHPDAEHPDAEHPDADHPGPDRSADLRRKVIAGTSWNFLGAAAERLIAFTVFALVVRHLVPSQVGIVTLAAVFIDLSLVVTNGGLPEALIRHENPTARSFDTAFWSNMALAGALAGIIAILAVPIGHAYAEPDLPPVLWTLAASFPLAALGMVHQARLARDFRFRALSLRGIAAMSCGGVVAITMAFTGWGIWALVAQRLVTAAISAVSVWLATGWVPGLRFDRAECRRLLSFGIRLTASTLLLQLTAMISLLVVGFVMDSAAVGYYRVATRLYDMVNQFVVAPVTSVALTAFAAVQADRTRFAALYARLTGVVALVAIAIFAGMAVLAVPLIRLVFGAHWQASAPLLAILCLAAAPFCVNIFVWPALTARGAAHDVLKFGLVQLGSAIAITLVAAPLGILAVACGQAARAYAVLPYGLRLTARHTGAGSMALVKPLVAPVLAALPMMGALLLLQHLLPDAGTLLILIIGVPLGAAIYAGALALIAPRRLADAVQTLRDVRRRG